MRVIGAVHPFVFCLPSMVELTTEQIKKKESKFIPDPPEIGILTYNK